MRWIEVKVESEQHVEEIISAIVQDICHPPSATDGGVGIYDNGSTIKAWIPADDRAEDTLVALRSRLDELEFETLGIRRPEITLTPVQDDDWALNFRNYFQSLVCGGFWIHPSWESVSCNPWPTDLIALAIDPGMAFGTGHHATTQLMLEILSTSDIKGKRILDMGAGSAILGIAAAKLGASVIDAVEIDPVAEENARLNIKLNNAGASVNYLIADSPPQDAEPYDFVVMNIVADVIKSLAPRVCSVMKPGATLACSGIIDERSDEVCEHLLVSGYTGAEIRENAEWRAIICQKK